MISLRSNVMKSVLAYFFTNPDERMYLNELARNLDLDKRNLAKVLKTLEAEGMFVSESAANSKQYSINKKYPLYEEFKKIVFKTVGVAGQIREVLSNMKMVEEAYLYGSFARDSAEAHSDIDVLVIGNEKVVSIQREITKLQKTLGREINVISMTKEDFTKRLKTKDPFITGIFKNKTQRLVCRKTADVLAQISVTRC